MSREHCKTAAAAALHDMLNAREATALLLHKAHQVCHPPGNTWLPLFCCRTMHISTFTHLGAPIRLPLATRACTVKKLASQLCYHAIMKAVQIHCMLHHGDAEGEVDRLGEACCMHDCLADVLISCCYVHAVGRNYVSYGVFRSGMQHLV
jgi:hypothetical protein